MKAQAQETLDREIAVVNFAGGGGSDDGIERFTDIMIGAAINHDPAAIRMHKTNHPYTEHFCEDVFQIDPESVCRGRKCGLAWFSPDCTHFSRAKGGTPVKKEIRGLSWVIVRWAMKVHPRVILMENVPEIRTWGPLITDEKGDSYPDPKRKGETFQGFIKIMSTGIEPGHPALLECCEFLDIPPDGFEAQRLIRGLGYAIEWKELCAADFGVPTIRERFFGVFRCDGQPIRWPEPTHARRGTPEVEDGTKKPWVPAASIIDWTIPAPSIFDSKKEIKARFGVNAVRPLADNTMKRIARGLDKFVLKEEQPFIVEVNHAGGFRGQSIHDPLTTITAKHGRGIVNPIMAPFTATNTSNAVGTSPADPLNTVRTGGGGGQMLVTPYLAQYHSEQGGDVRGQKVNGPIMTIDASNRYGVVLPVMAKYYGNDNHGQGITEPLHTVTAKDREALTLAHICKFKGTNLGQHPETPLHTVTATAGEFAAVHTKVERYAVGTNLGRWPQVREMLNAYCGYTLAANEVLLLGIRGEWWFITDIGLRMLTPREAFNAMGFASDYIIDRDYEGNEYKKTEQMARCGNAVCPPMAGLLAAVNLPEYARKKPLDTQRAWREAVAI
ncbi:DNA cytosine methyltransferase [Oscillibacter ruminantium]|uniref:DNA cytosine methyltransferase n=1 Tax=Oscillibacter ruminantium TaxID=1263547 RepID=UPI00331E9DF8